MDIVARTVEKRVQPHDLVLVNPFWLWPSFYYYYHGAAAWRVVPVDEANTPITWYGGLSLKQVMQLPNSIRPTEDLVKKTLQGGGKVWIVGDYWTLPPGEEPEELLPAPHPKYGWNNNEYSQLWMDHLGAYLQAHSGPAAPAVIGEPASPDTIGEKSVPLHEFKGWHKK